MNKIKYLLCIIALCFTGCTVASGAQSTVDSFYQALENGSLADAEGYLSDTTAFTDSLSNFEQVKDQILSADTSEKVSQSMEIVEKSLIKSIWKSHKVIDVQENGDTADVTVKVRGVTAENITKALSEIDYSTFNFSDLSHAYEQMADFLKNNVTTVLTNLSDSEYETVIHLEKKNAGWMITGISKQ